MVRLSELSHAATREIEDVSVATSLPPTHEPGNRDLNGLGAGAWAGILAVLGIFIVGVICWSGQTNIANATGAPASQMTGASTDPKTTVNSSDTAIR